MSIERNGWDEFNLTCDLCGDEESTCESYADAVELKRHLGWYSDKDAAGYWIDVCPKCHKPKTIESMKDEYKRKRNKR